MGKHALDLGKICSRKAHERLANRQDDLAHHADVLRCEKGIDVVSHRAAQRVLLRHDSIGNRAIGHERKRIGNGGLRLQIVVGAKKELCRLLGVGPFGPQVCNSRDIGDFGIGSRNLDALDGRRGCRTAATRSALVLGATD